MLLTWGFFLIREPANVTVTVPVPINLNVNLNLNLNLNDSILCLVQVQVHGQSNLPEKRHDQDFSSH